MIPLYARRRLLKHWRQGCAAVVVSPAIELLDFLSARAGPKAVGYCTCAGHKIQYLAPFVRLLTRRPLLGLILHEFVHAYCYARKSPGHNPPEDMDPDTAEDEAYFTLEWWDVADYDRELDQWWSKNKRQARCTR